MMVAVAAIATVLLGGALTARYLDQARHGFAVTRGRRAQLRSSTRTKGKFQIMMRKVMGYASTSKRAAAAPGVAVPAPFRASHKISAGDHLE